MADDKNPDSAHESEESTTDPTGAELADHDLADAQDETAEPQGDFVDAPDELKAAGDIVDPEDTPDDDYVDDPDTPDINEAKLDRATDEVAEDETASPGSIAQRRPRPNRPVRRRPIEAAADPEPELEEPAELVEADDDDLDEDSDVTRTRPGRARTTAPVRKGHATRTRKEAEAESRRQTQRTTPVAFVQQSIGELRKVVWPTGTQVQQYFVVVLVFVLFIMTLVSLLDLGFGWVILNVFG
ncbi:preprotein translocase subunit SecE [Ammonicoccus fulvus]|uniref:Protein translocase subunit SecE n=1 Tax=Ammonicoccus fulvus TaxID=3138240 RepID=A0ABZ3FNQ4_9ACTN